MIASNKFENKNSTFASNSTIDDDYINLFLNDSNVDKYNEIYQLNHSIQDIPDFLSQQINSFDYSSIEQNLELPPLKNKFYIDPKLLKLSQQCSTNFLKARKEDDNCYNENFNTIPD